MLRRYRFALTGVSGSFVLIAGTWALFAVAQPVQFIGGNGDTLIEKQTKQAVDQGLAYLASQQQNNGAWGTGKYHGNVAVTSLVGLAFMAGGHQPGRGPYGDHMSKAVKYLLSQEQSTYQGRSTPGFLYHRGPIKLQHGAMYEHGFGTLFLAEAYGMVYDSNLRGRLHATLRRAVDLIVNAQNFQGGWRYSPFQKNADLSVTVCQIMALRAARNAGIAVPKSVTDRCIQYVKDCQQPHRGGAFQYMQHGGHHSMPLTASGVVALYSAGEYDDQAIDRGLQYLRMYLPGRNHPPDRMFELHYYYGHYYAAQAMWIRGGKMWEEWYAAVRSDLLGPNRRRPDGTWFDGRICPHYCTAMALIVLQMPNNYLPIFQR